MKALIDYIEGLEIGQGRHAGEKFKLLPWESRFLKHGFSTPGDAALSIARGNGKTTFFAAIASACVAPGGPLNEPMAESLIVASSFDQGTIAFRHVLQFLRPSIRKYGKRFRIQDSANRATIQDRETGAMLRVLGSDPSRMHGAAPRILLLDEIARWPDPDSMLSALKTSRGKIPDSKALLIGTRAASPLHPFERALCSPAGYSQVHAAPLEKSAFQVATWKMANPGWAFFPDLQKIIREEAADAKRDATALASFRGLRLNQGVSDVVQSRLLDEGVWEAEEVDKGSWRRGEPYTLGLDLGQNSAMSGAAAYGLQSGTLDAFAVFPHTPSLGERGLKDGVGKLYVTMNNHGDLLLAGDRVSDVAALLRECVKRWGKPEAVVCDRWREAELRQTLDAVDFPRCDLIVRGQGFLDGSADVRAFRKALLTGKVHPCKSLLMRSAMNEARVVGDPAGNWKLSKGAQGGRRMNARDDAAAAGILAVSQGARLMDPESGSTPSKGGVILGTVKRA